jgi:hypothetical protein
MHKGTRKERRRLRNYERDGGKTKETKENPVYNPTNEPANEKHRDRDL